MYRFHISRGMLEKAMLEIIEKNNYWGLNFDRSTLIIEGPKIHKKINLKMDVGKCLSKKITEVEIVSFVYKAM